MVGMLLFLGNWAGPIWWSVAGLESVLMQSHDRSAEVENNDRPVSTTESEADDVFSSSSNRAWKAYVEHANLVTLFLSSATLATMLACAALRTHLFVWTVFSPKFLYAVAWLLGWHYLWNLAIGTLLVALG